MKWTASRLHFLKWRILPVIAVASIPVLLSAGMSCIKKPELKKAELGGQVSSEDIDNALFEALEGADPYAVTDSQAVLYIYNYRVETSEPLDYQRVVQDVREVIDTPNEFTIVYSEATEDLENGGEPVVKEVEMNFNPRVGATAHFLSLKPSSPSPAVRQLAQNPSLVPFADREYTSITYHNLKVSHLTQEAPASVKERPNCGDLPGCEMHVTRIEFDMALWYSDVDYDKLSSQWDISTDVPFLGTVVSDCTLQQQFIGDRDYVIRTCKALKDFIY